MYKLLLVDATNRARTLYHGSPDDVPSRFMNDIRRARLAFGSPPVVLCWDHPDAKKVRQEIFSDYKSSRDPNDMASVSCNEAMSRAMKDYCCWFDPRFEADDLIATLSAEAGDWPVAVYSSDKDLNPLLLDGPRAQLEKVDRVRNRMQWATPDSVFKKHGVRIEQFQEFLCLTGDDDIKGVPKIGKKTACQILEKYGTVDRAMEVFDVEDLPCQKSRFESLQAAYESGHWAKLCEALKLRRDAPIPQNVRETLQQASSHVGMIPRLTVARVAEAFLATDKPERPF